MAMIDMLCAVSPLDGRYGSKVDELREVFSVRAEKHYVHAERLVGKGLCASYLFTQIIYRSGTAGDYSCASGV